MIISEQWLREWVKVDLSANEIADCLTNAGLEVDGVQALPGKVDNLAIGQVLEVSKHPDADRLNLTKVDVGNEQLEIVCGAANVAQGQFVAVAMVGAKLPNGLAIKRAKVRGVESNGMLCSAAELGLEEDSDGILELADDAKIGSRVDDYLGMKDNLIDIDLTPNRGDCLSVSGIARELKFLADGEFCGIDIAEVSASHELPIAIELKQPDACPRYIGRVISGIDTTATTPIWMAERLRRSGVRPISPVVDITNYVMLEFGQPMHAFDFDKLKGGIVVRLANKGETIKLLDDSTATLDDETLIIADHEQPIAIAGVMGGAESAINDETHTIVLEAAHFTRKSAAGCARRYGLNTESSHRFERGVDPQLPATAIERATQLVLQICGGEAGQVCEQVETSQIPTRAPVELRLARLQNLLGMEIKRSEVTQILQRIVVEVQDTTTGWRVIPPSYRFDIEYEADLVEEVARVMGYDNIPTAIPRIAPRSAVASEARITSRKVRNSIAARDFREVVTYSFVDAQDLAQFSTETPVQLANPLAENMAVMRTSLLPGLVKAAQFNHNRQHSRLRLFEIGATYHYASAAQQGANPGFVEVSRLAVLISGSRNVPQWGIKGAQAADFYDLKSELEAVLSLTGQKQPFIFKEFEHIAMHPGQLAQVCVGNAENNQQIGVIGRLHPELERQFGFAAEVFVFELDLGLAMRAQLPEYQAVSRFPSVKRDLSLVVEGDLVVDRLTALARSTLGTALSQVQIFDVYQGAGIAEGYKSVSLSLTLQHADKTFTDSEAKALEQKALDAFESKLGATLRV